MRGTRLLFVASLLSLVSCDPSAPSSLPTTPSVPVVLPELPPAAQLVLSSQTTDFFVGEKTYLSVHAFDATGHATNSDKATLSSSDPTVITLADRVVLNHATGRQPRLLMQAITTVGVGTAILRATLDGVSASLVLKVNPLPPASTALVIDSFTVIEYRVTCAWDCPYLGYAPLLKLREPTGTSPVYVHAVQFDVSSKSTGLCTPGQLKLDAGFAGHINDMDLYLWFNSLVLVQLNGVPLPDGPARARVIFRDSRGVLGMAEAQAVIQRMVPSPQFPASSFAGLEWSCDGGT